MLLSCEWTGWMVVALRPIQQHFNYKVTGHSRLDSKFWPTGGHPRHGQLGFFNVQNLPWHGPRRWLIADFYVVLRYENPWSHSGKTGTWTLDPWTASQPLESWPLHHPTIMFTKSPCPFIHVEIQQKQGSIKYRYMYFLRQPLAFYKSCKWYFTLLCLSVSRPWRNW